MMMILVILQAGTMHVTTFFVKPFLYDIGIGKNFLLIVQFMRNMVSLNLFQRFCVVSERVVVSHLQYADDILCT
jgi:hypothetical protein